MKQMMAVKFAMKSLLVLVFSCIILQLTQGRSLQQLPDYLQQYSCRKSDPEYSTCVREGFLSTKPFFLEGIPELGVPPMDPYRVESFSVNRTINNLIKIDGVCRNVELTGVKNTVIEDLKADPIKHYGEVRLSIPWMYLEMEYDVKGQLLIIPLESKGHFQGNFTDTQMYMKASLKPYLKDGVEYFKVSKLSLKIRIGDGRVKLTSKEKQFQYSADLITDFFNENPRRVLDAINPIFIQYSEDFGKQEMNRVLAKLPASAWLPE